jgi:hypothetical protein
MSIQSSMKPASKQELVASILPQNWEEQKGASFSENDLIDAYLKGIKEERTTSKKRFSQIFHNNVIVATKTAEHFMDDVKASGLSIIDAF